eukprot:2578924-Prymnesium_polylepis.1
MPAFRKRWPTDSKPSPNESLSHSYSHSGSTCAGAHAAVHGSAPGWSRNDPSSATTTAGYMAYPYPAAPLQRSGG